MISLILYGRNDAHGYNLHRRAALSLNCLAEVLADPDDELVFVDYNTPDELPTFVEAIADTLTPRCLDRLRVLRVAASVHHRRYGSLTHLPVLEPVARNTAVRRTNPANRWLLSTNTDMVLVPPRDESLSDLCADLPDAVYGLPRFELPEWLWENLPRTKPEQSIAELRHLGPRLRLDEHTLSYEDIRFDAPGDFQLCLREDVFAIHGFDERMLLGWHVDSNLAKRLTLHRGSIQTIDRLAGYHCNHSRIPTVYQATAGVENDFDRFFFDVEESALPSQQESWGLVDEAVEEISIHRRVGHTVADSLIAAIPPPDSQTVVTTADWAFGLTYDSGHVLPFVADSIAVSPAGATIAYLGANPTFERMLGVLTTELDRGLTLVAAHDGPQAAELAASADLFVVDLGLDSGGVSGTFEPGEYPAGLPKVLEGLDELVTCERSKLLDGAHPRRFVLVNSTTLYTNAYVASHFDHSFSTMHSRVRRATVKLAQRVDEMTVQGLAEAARLLRWGERWDSGPEPLLLRVGKAVEIADLGDYRAFGAGWASPEPGGLWTRGERAEVSLRTDAATGGPLLLSLSAGRVGVPRGTALDVTLLIAGERAATRSFPGGTDATTWRVEIPSAAISQRMFEVVLEMDAHGAWADDRQLGLHVRSLGIQRGGLRQVPLVVVTKTHKALRVARSRIRIEST